MGRNCSETIPHKYRYALVEEMRGVAPPVFQHNGGAASLFKRSDLRLSSDKSWPERDSYDRAGVVQGGCGWGRLPLLAPKILYKFFFFGY